MSGADKVLTAELVAELRHLAQSTTTFAERLAGQAVNNVLDVFTATFDATASPITRSYSVAAGCVVVNNTSTHTITVSSAGPGPGGSAAPTSGVGIYQVAAGTQRTVALASRNVTFYGTATDSFSAQVFTAPVTPGTT